MTEKFCSYLGVSKNATMNEIKHAFRKKALLLHPDRNHSSYASDEFILLNDIYHQLVTEKLNEKKTKEVIISKKEVNYNSENILFAFIPLLFIWLLFFLLLDVSSIDTINNSIRIQTSINLLIGIIAVSSMQFCSLEWFGSQKQIPPILRFLCGYSFSLFGFLLFKYQYSLSYSILFLIISLLCIAIIIQTIAHISNKFDPDKNENKQKKM